MSRCRLFVSCVVVAVVVSAAAGPFAGAEGPAADDDSAPTSTTVPAPVPPSTSVPRPSTTVPPSTSTTVPPAPEVPASVTPTDPAPQPLFAVLPPVPAANPAPVSLEVSVDSSGAFGVAERAAVAAVAELGAATAELAAASVELERVNAEMDTLMPSATRRAAAADRAERDAENAAQVAQVAATEALISADVFGHPTTRLAVSGSLGHDEMWARGMQHAVAGPLAARARSTAREARETQADATDAAEEMADLVAERDDLVASVAELEARRAEAATSAAQLSAAADAARAALVAAGPVPAGERVSVLDIPTRTLDAYLLAAKRARVDMPACSMQWWVVAGIGAIETGHGTFRGAYPDSSGVVRPAILGPRLDGGAFARIGDTDGGRLDGDTAFDRAVGPMQFIPSTWKFSGRDGDGDGVADPHNVYDAAYSAAIYLCRGARGAAVDTPEGFSAAAWSYNRSRPYGAATWARATRYSAVSPRVLGGLSELG